MPGLLDLENHFPPEKVEAVYAARPARAAVVTEKPRLFLGDLTSPLPPLDPDPLHVAAGDATYRAGQEDGYESAIRDGLPPRAVVALVAIVAGIVGGLIGFAAGTMRW